MEREGREEEVRVLGCDLTNRKDLTCNEHIPYLQIMLLNTLSLK